MKLIMKTKDILDIKCSVLGSVNGYHYHQGLVDYAQTDLTIKQILNLGISYKEPIEKLRSLSYHSKEQKMYKEQFPCWFTGGIFPLNMTEDKDILEYSNILAIDIDKIDNPKLDIDEAKCNLIKLPYVILVSKSISGQGIFVLVLLEDGKYTKEYYSYLAELWNKMFGYNIDTQCTNIGRKRFISYDKDIYIKEYEDDVIPWKLKKIKAEKKSQPQNRMIDYNPNLYKSDTTLTRKAIWYMLNRGYSIDDINCTSYYGVWYHIGCEFRHFIDGESMFIKFSQNSVKYHDDMHTIMKKWENTKIESDIDSISRKWCGLCKNKLGSNWVSIVKNTNI